MFMVKDEFINIKNLLRVRFKTQGKGFIWFVIIMALILVATLFGTIIGIVRSDYIIRHYRMNDNSTLFLFAVAFGFVVQMFIYRNTNNKLSVYPQTNNSRFVSSLLYNYVCVVILGLTVLIKYLVQYGTIRLMSSFVDDVYLALYFDFGFVITGFFVYLIYLALIMSIIELVGVVLRKWKYYAVVAFAAAFALLIAYFRIVIENAPNVFSFLLREPSIIVFLLKATGLLLVITVTALVINHYTIYHKSQGQNLKKNVVIGCIAIAVVIMFVVPVMLFNTTAPRTGYFHTTDVNVGPIEGFFPEFEEIHIDISHLPRGSRIELKIDDTDAVISYGMMEAFSDHMSVFITGLDALDNLQDDMLIIMYRLPFFHIDGVDLIQFAAPLLEIYLEGNSLFISYAIESAQVIILPIWSIASQFDFFRDRGVFVEHPFGNSAGGSMSANIIIRVE